MAKAWKLDAVTKDRVIPLQIVDGVDEFRQRVLVAISTYLGEWFANTDLGVDFYGTILKRHPDIGLFKNEILKVLSGFEEVLGVNDVKVTKTNYENYEAKIEVYSIYGIETFRIEYGGELNV
jgi:hypothetical protein